MKSELENPDDLPDCGRPMLQRWLLRFAAIVLFTGLPGMLHPRAAIQKFSWLMGLDKPNLQPITVYLGGNAGYVFVALGILTWVISNDVARYRPLVIIYGWILLAGAAVYLWVDLQSMLPWWWVAMDSVSLLLLGAGILWACRRRTCGARTTTF